MTILNPRLCALLLLSASICGAQAGSPDAVQAGVTTASACAMTFFRLDEGVLESVAAENGARTQACYRPLLARFPELAGTVAVKFLVSPTGRVLTAAVALSTVGNAELESCVSQSVRDWRFPPQPPEPGQIAIITHVFRFAPVTQMPAAANIGGWFLMAAADASVQIAGVVMLVEGLASPRRWLQRDVAKPGVTFVPGAAGAPPGASQTGRF